MSPDVRSYFQIKRYGMVRQHIMLLRLVILDVQERFCNLFCVYQIKEIYEWQSIRADN